MNKVIDMIMDGLKLGSTMFHLDREHAEALVDERFDAKYEVHRAVMIVKALVQIAEDYCEQECEGAACSLACSRLNTLSLARAYLTDHEVEAMTLPPTCTWTQEDDWENSANWHTGCGEIFTFIANGPEENGAKYCQYCGKKTLIVYAIPDSTDDDEATKEG